MSFDSLKITDDIRNSNAATRPLRVAVFSDSALPVLNGVSVSVATLVSELRNQGHFVSLFTSHYPGFEEDDPATERFQSLMVDMFPNYPFARPPFNILRERFRQGKFDVVHTHTPFTLGVVGKRWGQTEGVPVVSTYHTHYDRYTHYVPVVPEEVTRRVLALHTRNYYHKVNAVITPSEPSREWLMDQGVTRPIHVIPTGIPEPRHHDRREMRTGFGWQPDEFVVLFVGRLAQEKNIAILIRAFAQIAKGARARLVLVGDGPDREELQALTKKLKITDRVEFRGFVPREHVDSYYAGADVFAFPSDTETQGLVVAEAMSYGLPVVVAQGGGASQAVKPYHSGLVVPSNVESFATGLKTLLADPVLRREWGQHARHLSMELTVPRMTESILSVYRQSIHDVQAS